MVKILLIIVHGLLFHLLSFLFSSFLMLLTTFLGYSASRYDHEQWMIPKSCCKPKLKEIRQDRRKDPEVLEAGNYEKPRDLEMRDPQSLHIVLGWEEDQESSRQPAQQLQNTKNSGRYQLGRNQLGACKCRTIILQTSRERSYYLL